MVRGAGVAGAAAMDMVTLAVADCGDEPESATETPKE
jgi:hypothetical protein